MGTSILVAIAGPTGVGKTELSLRLAERWGCPIVNCDSRQIYKSLPIGTAAPTSEELTRVRHYMVGTHTLSESYNAGEYERDAVEILTHLLQTAKDQPFAILSGGSMLYMDAVCNGLDDIPSAGEAIRSAVRAEFAEKGIEWLQQEVSILDPVYWQEVDRQNPQRLMHCIEICRATGKSYSSFRKREKRERPWHTLKIGLSRDREELYSRINRRVEQMIADGLEDEARRAYDEAQQMGYMPNSLCTVGYKEMIGYFEGKWDRAEAIRLIQQNSRHYAKRQMTWFRAQDDIRWIDMRQTIEEQTEQIQQWIDEQQQSYRQ